MKLSSKTFGSGYPKSNKKQLLAGNFNYVSVSRNVPLRALRCN